MGNKPYITRACLTIEIVSYLILFITAVVCIFVMIHTDGPIPTHYDFHGNVDSYGPAVSLLIVPCTMLFTNLIISLCLHLVKPEHWNTPFKIKPGHETIILHDMTLMMVVLELVLSLWALATTIDWGVGNGDMIFPLSMIMVVVTFVVIFGFTLLAAKHNKE